MYDETKRTDNYGDYEGHDWWVEGKLHVTGDIEINGDSFAPVENLASSASVGDLIEAMKKAGIMVRDSWVVDADGIVTTSALPTAEDITNVGHISTIAYADGVITITLDCKASELEDANHGTAWGTHKWLAFAVETGISPITGIKFTDSTGASATLGADDISEATALGISAGGFVLYIKAEDKRYLATSGGRKFSLAYPGYKTEIFTIKIVEPEEDDT